MPTIVADDGCPLCFKGPSMFDLLLEGFLAQIETGHWPVRGARSRPDSIWGPDGRPPQA